MMTSPVLRQLVLKTSGVDTSHDFDDHSQQTSLLIDRPQPNTHQSIQTSPNSERKRSDRCVQFAPNYTDRMTSPIFNRSMKGIFETSIAEMLCRSQQTSQDMGDRLPETTKELITRGVGPDEESELLIFTPTTNRYIDCLSYRLY
ncbi:unnamed protein product [Strongylus vulgaris]|uniref:Uncharacterized protein n=1 Tax=Strongylus vulgaris TaxID=40348 RepID=A0A3P7JIF9_STRVU|nr:unnamed protein product [Strongylus vulgaris]